MTKKKPLSTDDIVDEILEADRQRALSVYLNAGRRLQGLSADDLQHHWVAALRLMVRERTRESFRDLDDVNSELALRGIEPDESQAAQELEAMRAEIAASGPNDPGVQAAIAEHMEKREKTDG